MEEVFLPPLAGGGLSSLRLVSSILRECVWLHPRREEEKEQEQGMEMEKGLEKEKEKEREKEKEKEQEREQERKKEQQGDFLLSLFF